MKDDLMDAIILAMRKRRITAEALASDVGVSKATMYRMLSKHTDFWELSLLKKVLARCGLKVIISVV